MKKVVPQMDSPSEVAERLEDEGREAFYPVCLRCEGQDVYVNPKQEPVFFVCRSCRDFLAEMDREFAFAGRDFFLAEFEGDSCFEHLND